MTKVQFVKNCYPDLWLGLDAVICIEDPPGSIDLHFFLPRPDGQPAHKDIAITDGKMLKSARIAPGGKTIVNLTLESGKSTCLRILSSEPQATTEKEKRELGVILAAVTPAASKNSFFPPVLGAGARPDMEIPVIPGQWTMLEAFDRPFYVKQAGEDAIRHDPLTHYLLFGWRRGLEPAPDFDSRHYIAQVPGLKDADTCPFLHYLREGRLRGLSGRPPDSARRSKAVTPGQLIGDDVWTGRVSTMLEALGVDTAFLHNTPLAKLVVPLFDAEHYRKSNDLDASLSAAELFARYLITDYVRGVAPGPLFHEIHYLEQLAEYGVQLPSTESAFQHWLGYGVANKIVPTPLFCETDYLALNPDLKSYEGWLFEHWLLYGIRQNLQFDRNLRILKQSPGRASDAGQGTVEDVVRFAAGNEPALSAIMNMRRFRRSTQFSEIMSRARAIDPLVGEVEELTNSLHPPFHEEGHIVLRTLIKMLPKTRFKSLVLIPFGKLGGADFVAGVLCRSLAELGQSVLVLRTDQPDWERPDWFPPDVASVDLSDHLSRLQAPQKQRIFYEVLRYLAPENVFNVNSRAAFDTFEKYGARLKLFTRLYSYYFCSDQTARGVETGYPVWFFAPVLRHLAGALLDSDYLRNILIERFALGPSQSAQMHVLCTPGMREFRHEPLVDAQIASASSRRRPVVIWAGRFDRQKRFDLLVAIATAMPDVDFECWGKAVLDQPPSTNDLPANLHLHGTFKHYDELPLTACDGWLYTSTWDGMPTILIECALMGMPIVASAVGGVPELIDDTTGWPVGPDAGVNDYVEVLRHMLSAPDERRRRAVALRERAKERHNRKRYLANLETIVGEGVE